MPGQIRPDPTAPMEAPAQKRSSTGENDRAGDPHRPCPARPRTLRATVAGRTGARIGNAEPDGAEDQQRPRTHEDGTADDATSRLAKLGRIDDVVVALVSVLVVLELGIDRDASVGNRIGTGRFAQHTFVITIAVSFARRVRAGIELDFRRVGVVRRNVGLGVDGFGIARRRALGLGQGLRRGRGLGLGLLVLGLRVFGLIVLRLIVLRLRVRPDPSVHRGRSTEFTRRRMRLDEAPPRRRREHHRAPHRHGLESEAHGRERSRLERALPPRPEPAILLPAVLGPVLLATALLASGPARADCEPGDDRPAVSVGVAHAVDAVEVFLDPVSDTALRTMLELRRLVSEQRGRLRVDVRLVPAPGLVDPRHADARAWATAMAAEGRLLEALRLLTRDGPDRLYVRLQDRDGRVEVAREIGLPAKRHERAWRSTCPRRRSDRDDLRLHRRMVEGGFTVYRLPVFVLGDELFEDGPSLDKLRPALGRHRVQDRRRTLRPRPALPEPRALLEPTRPTNLGGALLGGVGLPHQFVLVARDEDDPHLFMLLPPILTFRRSHPERLSVRVVARGAVVGSIRLRTRLCAATRLGLVAGYFDILATEPSLRLADPAVEALLRTLDEVPEEQCDGDPDPTDLPDGGWLDGLGRTRSELDNLERTLDLIDASHRPLSPLLGTRPTDEP
jgi:hypothetical protein